jgi:hypothetical protein
MVYVLGVSSGAFGVTGAEEKPQLAGLFRKAQSSITKGVNFVQLDLESISEFEEPDLEKKMEKDIREKLGIKYGIHSETRAFGVEASELDSAIAMEYERGHRRIVEILKRARKIKSRYVLVHSSESEPFPLLERTFQSCDLVGPDGERLNDFLKSNEWLLEWIFGGTTEYIAQCIYDAWTSIDSKERKNKMLVTSKLIDDVFEKKGIKSRDFIWVEIFGGSKLSEMLRGIIQGRVQEYELAFHQKYEEFSEQNRNIADDAIKRSLVINLNNLRERIIEFVQSRSLHYGPERLAYYLVAKWMEGESKKGREPVWEKIVNAAIKFFAKRDGKTVEEWASKNGIDLEKLTIDDDAFRRRHELWVPAVSARYIYGHFFPKDKKKYEDPKEYLDENEMIFAFESPMGGRGIEEWLRLGNPYFYYFLVEESNRQAGKNIFAVAMDFEHMLSLRVDPETVIELLPEDGGKYVRIIHAGWPSTLAPAHLPIEIGSNQQKYLYEMYFKLRQKGFGKDNKEYFIVFERGGPETFQQSIVSLQLIVKFLEKDIPPEKLLEHPEFFGLDIGQMASIERQRVNIQEHAYDPLRGLISVPEEEHGFLGRSAVEKGKAEEWRKERFR